MQYEVTRNRCIGNNIEELPRLKGRLFDNQTSYPLNKVYGFFYLYYWILSNRQLMYSLLLVICPPSEAYFIKLFKDLKK